MYKVFGIPNCDTVKKALQFLKDNNIEYEFIDFKKDAPSKELIQSWKEQLERWPINTKGTTYRKIKEEFENASDQEKYQLIQEHSSVIKRPIISQDGKVVCLGYDAEWYEDIFLLI